VLTSFLSSIQLTLPNLFGLGFSIFDFKDSQLYFQPILRFLSRHLELLHFGIQIFLGTRERGLPYLHLLRRKLNNYLVLSLNFKECYLLTILRMEVCFDMA